jgi:hypothetical protein
MNYEYVDRRCLPEDNVLSDPSKLRVELIEKIWSHWLERQKNDERGLIFLKASGGDMREKFNSGKSNKKGSYEDDDGDNEDEDSEKGEEKNPEGEGEGSKRNQEEPHPESPLAHSETTEDRLNFLAGLSDDGVYQKFVEDLRGKIEVSGLTR